MRPLLTPERGRADRSKAQHEKIGGDGISQQRRGDAGCIQEGRGLVPASPGRSDPSVSTRKLPVGIAGEVAGDGLVFVDDGGGMPWATLAKASNWPTTMSQPSSRLAPPRPGPHQVFGCRRCGYGCRPRRSSGEAGHVHHRAALPSRWAAMPMRAPMVTTPVPPTPVTRITPWDGRSRARRIIGSGALRGALFELVWREVRGLRKGAMDGDEAGAEAVDAGEVLVAGRLVDLPLAPHGGFQRHDAEAVGLVRRNRRSPRRPRSLMKARFGGSTIIWPRSPPAALSAAQV